MSKTKLFFVLMSAPVVLFGALFGIPRLIATLFNSHSDVGLVGIVAIFCLIFTIVGMKIYNELVKEDENER